MPLQLEDRALLDAGADIRITGDGYLVAMPRVARTGIQLYRGSEVGRPEMDVVRVFRPEDQVFDKDSMRTFAFRPITDDHPRVPVTSKNWRDFSVGQSGGDVARDGEFLRIPMVVMDEAVIGKVKDGKEQLSVGYTCDLKWETGTDPNSGEQYDAIQTNIRANHIAIVKAARGGDKLKVGDGSENSGQTSTPAGSAANDGGPDMSGDNKIQLTVVDVDGVRVEMSDVSAQVVLRRLRALESDAGDLRARLEKALESEKKSQKDAETAIASAQTDAKTKIEAKDAEIETLKKQLADAQVTPEKLEGLVRDRQEVIGKAKAILGDKLVTDGKSIADIRKQVVDAKMGEAAKAWSEDAVTASFNTLTANVTSTAVSDAARAFSGSHQPGHGMQLAPVMTADKKEEMYRNRDAKLQDAWKGPTGTA